MQMNEQCKKKKKSEVFSLQLQANCGKTPPTKSGPGHSKLYF